MTQPKHRAGAVMLFFLAAAAFLLVWFRAPYGLDVTDESFWVAEPYLVTQGAVPFATLWIQTPLTMLLIAPLSALYCAVTGGTAGMVLFMFRAAVVVRAVIALGVWLALRRGLGTFPAGICAIVLFLSNMGHTRPLHYYVLSLCLLALAGVLAYSGVRQKETSRAAVRCAAAGAVMALCAMAHITQLVNCVLLTGVLLLLDRRRWKRLPLWLIYTIGGLTVAAAVVLGLELAGGGQVFSGLSILLQNHNYFQIPLTPPQNHLHDLGYVTGFFGRRLVLAAAAAFLPLLALCFAIHHEWKSALRQSVALAGLAGLCALIGWLMLRQGDLFSSDYSVFFCFLAVPLVLLPLSPDQRREALAPLALLYLPCLLAAVLTVFVSYPSITYRLYCLTGGAALLFPLGEQALRACFDGTFPSRLRRVERAIPLLAYLPAVLLMGCLAVNLCTNVYRDDPIPQQTYRVESGVYRGLYTSQERGKAIETLEKEIQSVTDAGESVLISDLFPAGYLMTDARACTPTSWDPIMYGYGFQDDRLFMEYFSRTGQTPDKILYIDSKDSPLSIDDPENEFAAWVREHYSLTDTFGDGLFPMRVYSRN